VAPVAQDSSAFSEILDWVFDVLEDLCRENEINTLVLHWKPARVVDDPLGEFITQEIAPVIIPQAPLEERTIGHISAAVIHQPALGIVRDELPDRLLDLAPEAGQ